MAWITPKTDWGRVEGETFNVDPDWNRIKNNMYEIQALAAPLFFFIQIPNIPDINYTVACVDNADSIAKTGNPAFPTAPVCNTIEDSLQILMDETYALAEFLGSEPRTPNGTAWEYSDFNRIESMQLRVYNLLNMTTEQRQRMPFKLGGGYFAEGLA